MLLDQMNDTAKQAVDAAGVGWAIATFVGANLPTITAVFVAGWTLMRAYETFLAIRLKHRELDRSDP